jgi:protease II
MCKRTRDTPNSEIYVAPLADPSDQRLLLAHRPDVKIEETSLSDGFYAILERSAKSGLQEIRVFKLPESKDQAEVRPDVLDGQHGCTASPLCHR